MSKKDQAELSETERIRRMRLRLAALRRHAEAKDPTTGKSRLAQAGGRKAGQKAVERAGCGTILGLSLAMARWHPRRKGARAKSEGTQRDD